MISFSFCDVLPFPCPNALMDANGTSRRDLANAGLTTGGDGGGGGCDALVKGGRVDDGPARGEEVNGVCAV